MLLGTVSVGPHCRQGSAGSGPCHALGCLTAPSSGSPTARGRDQGHGMLTQDPHAHHHPAQQSGRSLWSPQHPQGWQRGTGTWAHEQGSGECTSLDPTLSHHHGVCCCALSPQQ